MLCVHTNTCHDGKNHDEEKHGDDARRNNNEERLHLGNYEGQLQ